MVLVAALTLVLAGTATAALSPIEVVRYVMAGAPGKMPENLRCVSTAEIAKVSGGIHGLRAVGVTIQRRRSTVTTATVLLDWKGVCHPLHRFRTGRRVEPAHVIQALETVLHEKAHVQGIRTEWKATCWGIPGVVEQLRDWGYKARQLTAVKWYLVYHLDGIRHPDYQLRGRCNVGAPKQAPLPVSATGRSRTESGVPPSADHNTNRTTGRELG